jgi:hypothetical protein
MADYVSELRQALLRAADRAVGVTIARRGIPLAPQTRQGGQGLGRNEIETTFSTFATGYDGSLTVVPFMLDVSVLDGSDKLVD